MFTGTLTHRMQPSPDGSLNLNVGEYCWRAGPAVEATANDYRHAVKTLGDQRLKAREIAREVVVSYGSVSIFCMYIWV